MGEYEMNDKEYLRHKKKHLAKIKTGSIFYLDWETWFIATSDLIKNQVEAI